MTVSLLRAMMINVNNKRCHIVLCDINHQQLTITTMTITTTTPDNNTKQDKQNKKQAEEKNKLSINNTSK